jgi:hypothetical protein
MEPAEVGALIQRLCDRKFRGQVELHFSDGAPGNMRIIETIGRNQTSILAGITGSDCEKTRQSHPRRRRRAKRRQRSGKYARHKYPLAVETPSPIDAYSNFGRHAERRTADKDRGVISPPSNVGCLMNQRMDMDKTNPDEIMLEALHPSGIDEYAIQIAELYQSIIDTYAPVESAYRGAVECHDSMNGFSSSTNR